MASELGVDMNGILNSGGHLDIATEGTANSSFRKYLTVWDANAENWRRPNSIENEQIYVNALPVKWMFRFDYKGFNNLAGDSRRQASIADQTPTRIDALPAKGVESIMINAYQLLEAIDKIDKDNVEKDGYSYHINIKSSDIVEDMEKLAANGNSFHRSSYRESETVRPAGYDHYWDRNFTSNSISVSLKADYATEEILSPLNRSINDEVFVNSKTGYVYGLSVNLGSNLKAFEASLNANASNTGEYIKVQKQITSIIIPVERVKIAAYARITIHYDRNNWGVGAYLDTTRTGIYKVGHLVYEREGRAIVPTMININQN